MLMKTAIIKTTVLFLEIIIADTAGMIRKEKTGITPFIFTANTIASPIDI